MPCWYFIDVKYSFYGSCILNNFWSYHNLTCSPTLIHPVGCDTTPGSYSVKKQCQASGSPPFNLHRLQLRHRLSSLIWLLHVWALWCFFIVLGKWANVPSCLFFFFFFGLVSLYGLADLEVLAGAKTCLCCHRKNHLLLFHLNLNFFICTMGRIISL